MRPLALAALAAYALSALASANEPTELKSTPLAKAFGSAPVLRGVQLSPDGTKISTLQMHPSGVTIARTIDLANGTLPIVLSGKKDEFDISWCRWANDERLLCGMRGLLQGTGVYYVTTRLVAVAADGSELKVLFDGRRQDGFAQFQDRIVDWLPDDPRHVLLQVPSDAGSGVSRLNIYTGAMDTEDRRIPRVYEWISDGHGIPRLYMSVGRDTTRWYVRDTPEADWSLLHETPLTDLTDAFTPLGFGEARNELLLFDNLNGRRALFKLDLANGRERQLVFAHPEFDVASIRSLGKYERLVAATYVDDRTRLEFFDRRVAAVHEIVAKRFPDKSVSIIDESWDQRYYLTYVNSATDPGSYYRFDSSENVLLRIAAAYPAVADQTLAPVSHVQYQAKDGTQIPAYLTLPAERTGRVPAVILPHGGPSSRDYWTYDFLAQFLAASGYAVLQSNYRGSGGYGGEWIGEGGFREWRKAVSDITDGVDYLVTEGIADRERICAVGWSYGGYAALLSVIEHPDLYRCVVSIAGVTDPGALSATTRRFIGGASTREFIGGGDEVFEAGSPIRRTDEMRVPVLLVHPREDANVPFTQSGTFARALERADKNVEFIEYEEAEHDIEPERYRIDLLTRLGEFLDAHIGQ
jgi:dipeptidyl aminopeptidase/acylaminoacyl peptidase